MQKMPILLSKKSPKTHQKKVTTLTMLILMLDFQAISDLLFDFRYSSALIQIFDYASKNHFARP